MKLFIKRFMGFALVLLLTLICLLPAFAAGMPSADNLYGEWLLNESLTNYGFSQGVKFTTKNGETSYANKFGMQLAKSSSGYWWLYYYNTEALSSKSSVYSFSDAAWMPSSTYRWVDFGDEGQVVSEGFFTWLTSNAILLTPVDPDGPVIDSVFASITSLAPYTPGSDVYMTASVVGSGFAPGDPEDSLYAYLYGNTSPDTYLDGGIYSGDDFVLHIAPDETSTNLEVVFISTYDTSKKTALQISITYPLDGVQIIPSGTQKFVQSDRHRELQFSLLLPNGDPYNNPNIRWIIEPSVGAENYYAIDRSGTLYIKADAPAGSSCNVRFAYKDDLTALSPAVSSVQIITQQQGIIDSLSPTPDQSDKADQMEDAISDAAGKLENNNSSLGQLTPTRPQINTNLEFDQEQMLAVSPLVTNIWSINGLGRMISIVLVVATVAYIFFGKRDG